MIYNHNPLPPNRNQKPDLCSVTCLQMILDRRGISYGPRLDDLALKLGVCINEKNKEMFSPDLAKRAVSPGDARIGLLFERFREPEMQENIRTTCEGLETKHYYLSEIGVRNVREFVVENIKDEKDIMINYKLIPFNGRKDGHYVLIFGFDVDHNIIYASDPSPFIRDYWKHTLSKFLYAMKPVWPEDDNKPRERGFITFKGPMKREKMDPNEILKIMKDIGPYIPLLTRLKRETINPRRHEEFQRQG